MSDDLVVRPAHLDDLNVIVELRLALLQEYAEHPLYARLRPDVARRAHDLFRAQLLAPHERMFVAERDGVVVGVMRCVDTASSPLLFPERYCYVSSVYVRPSERKRGVLRALVAAADSWCAELGLSEMRLHNASTSAAAQGAWSALGFEVVEQVRRRALA